ncbi:DNA polymerase/3'-5' exonuclease PolX [Pseudomonas sp. GCM10022188]|uniref:DNA polymerase/3'-5' exonuclease PolX n=1 Tax=Pseudomonas TaxID=286 RepID=UPI001E5518E6|nr:DNA polymerase/3'-5' exonuclease PolX [Pseudomonas oryzagri]MCC6073984.1 DNA polymerase/3'-5' exonuclease PolX [Pseudomonas oryzagri]
MTINNAKIAAVFEEIADILELQGANAFRVRAYRNAARVVRAFAPDIAELLASGQTLPKLPGIGEDLATKIAEIAGTGQSAQLQRLRGKVPEGLPELLTISGLGPKRVARLWHELGIQTLTELRQAARSGRIRTLEGFGGRTEERLLQAVDQLLHTSQRRPLGRVAPVAEHLLDLLREVPGVLEAVIAGSFRRGRDTVGDLDILVSARAGCPAIPRFTATPEVATVLSAGTTRASVLLHSGLQVDLRLLRPASWGAGLVYLTGSKAHTIELRRMAQDQGLKISEYGVYRGRQRIAGATEESVYQTLDLPWIPPELREAQGEIAAAAAGKLPKLVELDDLRGDLHAHTYASDGQNSLEEMAAAARDAGLQYLAITDRTWSASVARGLDADALARQIDQIDALNAHLTGITLLKGVEVEILEDGSLDLPDSLLARLDLVVGAVHSAFALAKKQQTQRLLRALEHPHFSILAHPGARLLGERPPIEYDFAAVLEAARQRGCALEVNAQPERLDLDDVHCRAARDAGVAIAICSGARSVDDFACLRFGVGQARRGWVEAADVLNTRPLAKLRRMLKR